MIECFNNLKMRSNDVCVVLFVFSVLGTLDAAITGWTVNNQAASSGDQTAWSITLTEAIAENSVNVGDSIITVKALPESTYTYTLVSSTDDVGVMGDDGTVHVATGKTFDFEINANRQYVFEIEARDAGDTVSSTVTVTVSITDIKVTFDPATYSTCIADTSATGTTITTVSATEGSNTALTYTIKAGNTNEEFAIGPSSGVIRVTKSLTSRSYTLTVNAADGSGDLEDSAEAVVTVTTSYITGWTSPGERAGADVHIAVSQAIAENSKAAGEEIFTAEATPQADGSITSYTLIYSNDSVGVIGQNGGIVNVAAGKNFDFETYPSYVFIIMATERCGGKGTATITVSISDVNEPPSFTDTSYSACISDGSASGTTLTTLTATDPDTKTPFNDLSYSLSGIHFEDFTVDESHGEITVAEGKSIDGSKTSKYSLTVKATDGPGLMATTNLIVNVMADCNSASVLSAATLTMALALLACLLD